LAFLKPSRKDSAPSKDRLKKREALLLNSYNLRNVVNNSLSLTEVLTFYFGSAVRSLDILASRPRREDAGERFTSPAYLELPVAHQNFSLWREFDVYANVNFL